MSRPRVLATRRLPGDALDRLAEEARLVVWPGPGAIPAPELARQAADADGLICVLTDRIDRAFIAACPRLRALSTYSVGVDHIDLVAASERGIQVGHTPGVLTETTADLAFGLLLAAGRRVAEGDRFVRAGRWTADARWEPDMLLGRDLWGATLGIVGFGEIGAAVARRAAGFGMRVLAWSRTRRAAPSVEWMDSLPALLAASDFVSLHVPLTPETRGLIGADALAALKPGAVLVNTARGPIVDEVALAAALREGRVGAAGLDVFDEEPLAADSPLLGLENVVLLPHIGSASVGTRARMAELCVENLRAALAGRPVPHFHPAPPGGLTRERPAR